jgi:hypothetical protein
MPADKGKHMIENIALIVLLIGFGASAVVAIGVAVFLWSSVK